MNNKKFIAAIAAGALALGCTIGGTVAWLTASSDTVVNTFTTSDINVELKETNATKNAAGDLTKSFQMIPGWYIEKDPVATVKANSVDCYLFVKLEKSTGFDTYMTTDVDTGWTLVSGTTDVYYREVAASTADQSFDVLKDMTSDDNVKYTVQVKGTVTKSDMETLKTANPTLTVTAYASQKYSSNNTPFAPETAWANVNA